MSTYFADIFRPYNEEFKKKITNVVFWEDHSTELKEVAIDVIFIVVFSGLVIFFEEYL